MQRWLNKIINADCLEVMKQMPDKCVQMCVTSPPYWGLRDYGCDGQLGLEKTPEEYIGHMVGVFREVKRVLKDDGTLWLNIGDSYAGSGKSKGSGGCGPSSGKRTTNSGAYFQSPTNGFVPNGCKPKDLVGIPWMLAFALRADGWYLRQDIIWHKPNPMPESVRDRCTKSHEYLFLLTKRSSYYFDQNAIKEPIKKSSLARLCQDVENQEGSDRVPGKTNGKMKAVRFGGNKQCPDTRLQSGKPWQPECAGGATASQGHSGYFNANGTLRGGLKANKRSVWSITTKPFKEAHFATFPEDLVKPCILAGSQMNDIVLDPFMGAGTVAVVAKNLGRFFVGIEVSEKYCRIAEERLKRETAQLNMFLAK